MKIINYYDLDGTLSKLNNSFHFAYGYYHYKNIFVRRIVVRVIHSFIELLFFMPYANKRRIILTAMFFNIKKESLTSYYNHFYSDFFIKHLTELGEKVIKKDNSEDVLLTGCTEIPANAINDYFGFKKVVFTTFKVKNDRIKGIDIDTFGNYKANYVERKGKNKLRYYTDDEKTEQEIKKKVDEFILVKRENFRVTSKMWRKE